MTNELTHFGVRGMKWGVRRTRTSTKSSKPKMTSQQKKQLAKVWSTGLLGGAVGALSFRALASQTDLALSDTAMYVATLLGSSFGASAALELLK